MSLATETEHTIDEVPQGFSAEEWQVRLDLAACYRLVHLHGWTSQVYNHITARVPGSEAILINPFGLAYDEITPSNLVKIDLEGNRLDASPYPVNQAGYVIHSAIHGARSDIACVLHTHSENAVAVSCLEEGFVPMTQTGFMFHERIGSHEYEGIALDLDERERLVADFGPDNHTLLLYNHGLITTGPSVAWAFTRLYHFEDNAAIQLKVMASGGTLKLPSRAVMERTRNQFEDGAAQAGAEVRLPEWPAYLRMVDRADPGWRR